LSKFLPRLQDELVSFPSDSNIQSVNGSMTVQRCPDDCRADVSVYSKLLRSTDISCCQALLRITFSQGDHYSLPGSPLSRTILSNSFLSQGMARPWTFATWAGNLAEPIALVGHHSEIRSIWWVVRSGCIRTDTVHGSCIHLCKRSPQH
jgi:hypothetical protein